MIEVAIVGAGPAGSYCAYCLAGKGIYPVLFDHSHPREKPCGGLLSPVGQQLFPFLERLPIKRGERGKLRLISPGGRSVYLTPRSKLLCFSRLDLDLYLLNMALNRGAQLRKEKVIAVERKAGFWKLQTSDRSYQVKLLIGADGVNSLVRRTLIGPLNKLDQGVCCGYLMKGLENEDITIRLLAHRKGYMWIIPRYASTSIGIGASEASRSFGLRRELDIFIARRYPYAESIFRWTALIPNVKDFRTFKIPVAGRNWILIGDAAGHVSPTTGVGLVYALLDGELAARVIAEKKPAMFDHLWKDAYGRGLSLTVWLRNWLYTRPGLELACTLLNLALWMGLKF